MVSKPYKECVYVLSISMTETTLYNGRFGNQVFRNVAVSIIAQKHNLHCVYSSADMFTRLGITLYSGTQMYENMVELNDDNYFAALHQSNLSVNLDPNQAYFQTRDISRMIHSYLNYAPIKNKIIANNPYQNRYANNDDIFIHIRLSDVAQHNPGIQYYLYAISRLPSTNVYIATDDPTHNIITQLLSSVPNTYLYDGDEIHTIQFGSTCKYVILSHGSFSSTIGYLSFFSNVYYPEYDHIWFGNMFSIDGWVEIKRMDYNQTHQTNVQFNMRMF